ncbi:MAG TPA: pyruvate kinase, partial [Chloroflexota bacterium]|nr:pyruvate kinase [Chloroflexota bacterium]
RLNASHGTHADHRRRLAAVREASRELGKTVAILFDLQGPKVRVGTIPAPGIDLKRDQRCVLSSRPDATPPAAIPVDYEPLPREVRPGDLMLLDDGNVTLRVEATSEQDISCRVERGGRLTSHKGINVPGAPLSAPALTEKDIADTALAMAEGVDFIALSFVRRAADVELLRGHAGDAAIIAKIERPEALDEIEAILQAADGVMVARGDLGVEIPLEQVPAEQRRLLQAANHAGKPSITATQMLESMITHSRPTRAEATDVYVAVLQLTDAVMLSAETAIGAYPAEAVKAMATIAATAEAEPDLLGTSRARVDVARDATEAVAQAACDMATELQVKAIVTSTSSGFTPRMVAKYRPAVPVVALAHDARVRRRLMLTWGVVPLASPQMRSTDEMLATADRLVVDTGIASRGDLIVITAGVPLGIPGHTNLIKVHRLGDPVTSGL